MLLIDPARPLPEVALLIILDPLPGSFVFMELFDFLERGLFAKLACDKEELKDFNRFNLP